MGLLALIQEILALPGQVNALLARIDALEALIKKRDQQNESAAISKMQTDTQNAKTDEDYKKAADEAAAALRNL